MTKEIFIPFNTPSSKNSKQWTGKFLVSNKNTQKWKKDTKKYWEENKADFLEQLKGLPKPYNIEFTFIRKSKHKFDYINPMQTVADEMVHHGWIEDDNVDEIKPFFGNYKYDKNTPGVIIKVLNFNKMSFKDFKEIFNKK
jgi:hypothetical protein